MLEREAQPRIRLVQLGLAWRDDLNLLLHLVLVVEGGKKGGRTLSSWVHAEASCCR